MKLTRTKRAALAASLKSTVAQSYIARLNAEEMDFRTHAAVYTSMGRDACQDRREWLFTRSTARRPHVKYTDTVSLTKQQVAALEGFLSDGGAVWCGLELVSTGATAILCRHDIAWIVIYEDGSFTKGVTPGLNDIWPLVLQSSKIAAKERAAARKPSFKRTSLGGYSINRQG